VPFEQYRKLRTFPLVRQGRNKSGFIAEVNNKRLNPFGLLANRTIGLARANAQNVGLERTYDTLLKGQSGKRLVRYIAGGTYVPVEGYEIEAENGKDIITTLDVNIQDIAENALLNELIANEADHGTCIVMEVTTGKIKAIANLGRQPDGSYWEDLNYAIRATEPGSTFKLATLLTLLEDKQIRLTDYINIQDGWKVGRRTVYDSEKHENNNVTVKQAFEVSSNVGMAKMVYTHYADNPEKFVNHLRKLKFDQPTGIDLVGETNPIVKNPKSRTWSATTLPWMAFGYEVLVSPLQTLTLYNAIANNGRMMKPYLVNAIQESGITVKTNQPQTVVENVCSQSTLRQLQECLEGVCIEGTAKDVFKGSFYKVAGKTGTALVANGSRGYADHIYQSSFAGYFPVDNPVYSCIVVVKNRPYAKKYYGAAVAGPVFKEVADKLMSENPVAGAAPGAIPGVANPIWKRDSSQFFYAGSVGDMKRVSQTVGLPFKDSAGAGQWGKLYAGSGQAVLVKANISRQTIPDVKGMGLKDALYLLESIDLRVAARGRGKVKAQSIEPGTTLQKNETIILQLN